MKFQHVAAALFALATLACTGWTTPEAPAAPESPTAQPPKRDRGASQRERDRRGQTRKKRDGAAAPAVDSPAYKTFETEGGKDRIVFTTGSKLKKTWSNMNGDAVTGSWTQSGDTVEVRYLTVAHHGSSAETFVTRGECSLIRTTRVDADTGRRIASPTTYVLDEPRCQ